MNTIEQGELFPYSDIREYVCDGMVGALIGNTTLGAITQIPASIMFFIFSLLAFFFAFNISPDIFLKFGAIFKRDKEEDSELADLKKNSGFVLNEGVPVEHSGTKSRALKNSVQKLTAEENHEALTVKSDPSWKLPSISLLNQEQDKADPGDVEAKAQLISDSFANFNINVEMEGANVGPRVTQYTLKPGNGVKLSKLAGYADNLAYDLEATSIRIEAPIPGKRAVGIEIPNKRSATVRISCVS